MVFFTWHSDSMVIQRRDMSQEAKFKYDHRSEDIFLHTYIVSQFLCISNIHKDLKQQELSFIPCENAKPCSFAIIRGFEKFGKL